MTPHPTVSMTPGTLIPQEAPKVLIGERDGIVAADLEALFQSWGFQRPRLAKNLDEVFRLSDTESFDMVVVDENIHEYPNFVQTLRRLLGSMKGRVVYLSDFVTVRLPETLLLDGAFHALSKPFNYSELQFIAASTLSERAA